MRTCCPIAMMRSWRGDGLRAEYQEQAEPEQIYSGVSDQMLRGYRVILCAVVGLALSGAALPRKEAVTQQSASQPSPSVTPLPEYMPYPERCYGNRNHDIADLCAQWRAAVAAEKASETAYWSNWIASAGALLSFVSIVLVVIALGHTRKANEITRNGQRAWMTDAVPIKTEAINSSFAGMLYTDAVGFNHAWENTGPTPAIEARCLTTISIVAFTAKPERHTFPNPDEEAQIVGPGKKISGPTRMLSDQQTAAFRARTCKVFVYSRIEYFDIFEGKRLRVSEACHEAFAHGGTINDDPSQDVIYRAVGSQNTLT